MTIAYTSTSRKVCPSSHRTGGVRPIRRLLGLEAALVVSTVSRKGGNTGLPTATETAVASTTTCSTKMSVGEEAGEMMIMTVSKNVTSIDLGVAARAVEIATRGTEMSTMERATGIEKSGNGTGVVTGTEMSATSATIALGDDPT